MHIPFEHSLGGQCVILAKRHDGHTYEYSLLIITYFWEIKSIYSTRGKFRPFYDFQLQLHTLSLPSIMRS